MKSISKTVLSLETAAIAIALAGLAGPTAAAAQDTPAEEACVDANNNGVCDSEERGIVVTGSRIARPTLGSPVPLTTVSTDELVGQGDVSLGDALNDLPSLRSTYSQGNSTRFIGTAGLNLLDLRGLGISRTLVLVNGRRHITASPGDYLVDVNTIPIDLLERVDVVTGGNSAVYGSDAVAGVVNFVLKKSFDGISIKGQGATTSRGDRGSYFLAGVAGKNFADGRGNVAIALEYARAEPLFFRDRDYLTGAFSGRCQFNVVEPTAGEPFGTDGIIDQAFVCGVKNAAISDSGTIAAIDPSSSATRRYLRFDDLGNVVVDTPTQSFAPFGSGNQQGGLGATLRNTGMMAAGVERYTANLLAHYDISDAFRPFIEAKYVRITASQQGQPSFFNSVPSTLGGPAIRCNNPFLTAQNLTTLQSFGVCTNVAAGTLPLARFNIDLGGRGEQHKRETFRIVTGIEGTFNEDWNYELSFNYGRLETELDSINNLILFNQAGTAYDGFNLAVDAVLAPVGFTGTNFVLNSTGQRVICGVNSVTNTRPDCVPVNVFGFGRSDPRAVDFVNTEGHRDELAEEIDILATISGDLSQLFELPGGPVGFAIGGEYREEKASSAFDALTASGATFLNAIQPFNPPKLTVKEAFAELSLPLLKDMPLAHELTISGAGRVSDYNTPTGTVWAYNVQGIYAPIPDIRFRAAYATSVRTPTQSDLYFPFSQNFAFIADPCDSANITAGPNRTANCAAAGVPTTYNAALVAACAGTAFPGVVGAPFRNCLALSSSTGFVSGGNPTLIEEKGRSLTIGAVFEPRFIPGLNLTVDWYRINVKDRISALAAQTIINLCYDSPSGIANPFCATVNRASGTGLFVQPAVISGGVNFAAFKTEGVDFDLQYRRTFDNGQKLSIRGIATWVRRLDQFVDPTNPINPDRLRGELGDPIWGANLYTNYDFGKVDVTYNMRYIGRQTIGTWEAQHSYNGICPASGLTGFSGGTCTPGQLSVLDAQNNDLTAEIYYPAAFYHNIRVNFELADKKYNFYVGVDNFTDKKPPFGLLGTAGGDPYDTYGRYMYAGFKANF
ncbi:MAG: TonB-dependent receptor domain-containing protein [Novosphingobium sp.]